MKNPWRGLASYTEEGSNDYQFCGRENAINELYTLTDNNLFVTLYGKTGIGKTSLLQAGLFPILRKHGYFPVMIRLGMSGNESSFAQNIQETVCCQVKEQLQGLCISSKKDKTHYPAEDIDSLWEFFHTTEFKDKTGKVIFPVIVLDQFEEILLNKKREATILLQQIYALLDDNRQVPSNSKEYSNYTNFRFIISIREDDLYRLEDILDRQNLPEMKQNRYRLTQLSDEEAKRIITIPGRNCIKASESDKIAERIIQLVKGNNEEISTAILSLVCSRLFETTLANSSKEISLRQVENFSTNPLEEFYKEAVSKLPLKERQYIENKLVTDDGRRESVSSEEFKKQVPNGQFLFDADCRLLQYVSASSSSQQRIEVIHDLLAQTIAKVKRELLLTEQKRKVERRNRIMVYSFIGFTLLLGVIWLLTEFLEMRRVFDGEIKDEKIISSFYKPNAVPSGILNLKENVTVTSTAFRGNPDIHTLRIGSNVTIGNNSFSYCPNLKKVFLEGKHIQIYPSPFFRCPKLETIIISKDCIIDSIHGSCWSGDTSLAIKKVKTNGNPQFKWLYGNTLLAKSGKSDNWHILYKYSPSGRWWRDTIVVPPTLKIEQDFPPFKYGKEYKLNIENIDKEIPSDSLLFLTSEDPQLESIHGSQFRNNKGIYHINLPLVKEIANHAFYDCSNLQEAILPQVEKINSNAFYFCNSLQSVTLPEVKNISMSAFEYCTSLIEIKLPKVISIKDLAFKDCTNLKKVEIPYIEELFAHTFTECKNLKNIHAPRLQKINNGTFGRCDSLEQIDFPEVKEIAYNAFINCTNLQTIKLPKVKKLGSQCFFYCTHLQSVDLPEVLEIEAKTFGRCDSLKEIRLPRIEKIGSEAFYECKHLTRIEMKRIEDLDYKRWGINIPMDTIEINDTLVVLAKRGLSAKRYNTIQIEDSVSVFTKGPTEARKIKLPSTIDSINIEAFDSIPYLEKLSVSFFNKKYYSWKNGIYGHNTVRMLGYTPNSEEVYIMRYVDELKLGRNVKKLYVIPPVNLGGITMENKENCIVYIPYGYTPYCKYLPEYKGFKEIVELSGFETFYYRFSHLTTHLIHSYYVSMEWYGRSILFILLLLAIILLYCKKKLKQALIQIPYFILLLVFCWIIYLALAINLEFKTNGFVPILLALGILLLWRNQQSIFLWIKKKRTVTAPQSIIKEEPKQVITKRKKSTKRKR